MIFTTKDCIEVYDFLKLKFSMCTNVNNYFPVRSWFEDENEEERWGFGYRDDMIAQFRQELYNRNFTLQDQGKDDPIDTFENKIKILLNVISNARGPVADNLHDYDYNDEGLDHSVHGAEIFPEIGELKKLLDKLRCK